MMSSSALLLALAALLASLASTASAAVVISQTADGWTRGRATFFDASDDFRASFEKIRGEGSFGDLHYGSCGYFNKPQVRLNPLLAFPGCRETRKKERERENAPESDFYLMPSKKKKNHRLISDQQKNGPFFFFFANRSEAARLKRASRWIDALFLSFETEKLITMIVLRVGK